MTEIPGPDQPLGISEETIAEFKRRALLVELSYRRLGKELSLVPEDQGFRIQKDPLLNIIALPGDTDMSTFVLLCDNGSIIIAAEPPNRPQKNAFNATFAPNRTPLHYPPGSEIYTIDNFVSVYQKLGFPLDYGKAGQDLTRFRVPVRDAIEASCILTGQAGLVFNLQRKAAMAFFGFGR